MRILVTGGAGFIGSTVVDSLLALGHSVTVIDDFNDFYDPLIKEKNISRHRFNENFILYKQSICDVDRLENIFQNNVFDQIVHLAARAGVRPSLANPRLYCNTNIIGTLNLLELAKKYEIQKFVFASSSSVYGNSIADIFHEDLKLSEPISPYAATKLAGEQLTYTYSKLHGIITICLRFFTVYGPRQRPDLAIAKFIRLLIADQPIPMFGDGSSIRDYTFIGDIVDGILSALNYQESPYEIINLGGGEPIRLSAMIDILAKQLGRRAQVIEYPPQPGDVDRTAADISKAKRLLSYTPKTTFKDGIQIFVDWLLQDERTV